jgi:hypothetical protein
MSCSVLQLAKHVHRQSTNNSKECPEERSSTAQRLSSLDFKLAQQVTDNDHGNTEIYRTRATGTAESIGDEDLLSYLDQTECFYGIITKQDL